MDIVIDRIFDEVEKRENFNFVITPKGELLDEGYTVRLYVEVYRKLNYEIVENFIKKYYEFIEEDGYCIQLNTILDPYTNIFILKIIKVKGKLYETLISAMMKGDKAVYDIKSKNYIKVPILPFKETYQQKKELAEKLVKKLLKRKENDLCNNKQSKLHSQIDHVQSGVNFSFGLLKQTKLD